MPVYKEDGTVYTLEDIQSDSLRKAWEEISRQDAMGDISDIPSLPDPEPQIEETVELGGNDVNRSDALYREQEDFDDPSYDQYYDR